MDREHLSQIKGVDIVPYDDLRREETGEARTIIRQNRIAVVNFNNRRATGIAVPYITGLAIANGGTNLNQINVRSFFNQDVNTLKGAYTVTVSEQATKGFVYMDKDCVERKWEEFQVMLPPAIVHDLGEKLEIPVWPWVELEAGGYDVLRATSQLEFPYVTNKGVHDAGKSNFLNQLHNYGKPVYMAHVNGREIMPKALMMSPQYQDEIQELSASKLVTVPDSLLLHTRISDWDIPDDEIWVMKDAKRLDPETEIVFLPPRPKAQVRDFLREKSHCIPMSVDDVTQIKFYDMYAGKSEFWQMFEMAATALLASENASASYINVNSRFKSKAPHRVMMCNDPHGGIDLLSKTQIEGGPVQLRSLQSQRFQKTLNNAFYTVSAIPGNVVEMRAVKEGRPVYMIRDDERTMGAVLHARRLARLVNS
ncbi:MAG: hypothetical protein H6868_05805 [Rhodospirillales bacterium]|nr:hypothetical protein [Rhodospirillales bacterium]